MLYIPIPIIARNVTIWLLVFDNFVHLCLDSFSIILERQEHRAYICLLYFCKFCSVIFFLWQSEFMPFNFVALVILDACKSYNTLLNMTIHDLSIDVHSLLIVLLEVAIADELEQILSSLLIHLISIGVGLWVKVNLWLVDVEEAHRVSVCHLARFVGVQDIIGGRDDLVAVLLICEEPSEWSHLDSWSFVS